jgi:hypothetical protein
VYIALCFDGAGMCIQVFLVEKVHIFEDKAEKKEEKNTTQSFIKLNDLWINRN